MRVRNVDANNDWTFGQNLTNYVQDEYAVILDIKMRLKEWFRDCFFELDKGIPWRTRLGFHNQKEQLDNDIINTIMSVDGVLNIDNFSSRLDGRHYIMNCGVYTQYSFELQPIELDTRTFSI